MILNTYKLQLIKENGKSYPAHDRTLDSPSKVANLLFDLDVDKEPIETLYLLLFDARLRLIGLSRLSTGTATMSIVDPKAILQTALLSNAVGIMLAHNHPSGDCAPSLEDRHATDKVKQVCDLVGIHFHDHLIIGHDGQYFSFSSYGMLED